VHFVLHDVPANDRALVVANVVTSLREGGSLYLREPVEHGLSAAEMRDLLWHAGLEKVAEEDGSVPMMGRATSQVWVKRA
jgi:hypothetical protein